MVRSRILKMDASIVFILSACLVADVGHYVKGEAPYNIGPNDPYNVAVNPNYIQQPSQRLFWDKFGNNVQGANQVGGSGGLWTTLTNKFPFLGNMFGRMELPSEYGVPNQYDVSTQYNAQGRFHPQSYPQTYQNPQFYQTPQYYQTPQFYQAPQVFRSRNPQQLARDVALTDDAVIVTPPHVPIGPLPGQRPVPASAPIPEPSGEGYRYDKPQYRLELPHK